MDKLVCIDEIQRRGDLFPVIRSLCDDWGGNGHFLVLGSASRDPIRQSSESLAGRIRYERLTPFLFPELDGADWTEYLFRGGFPRACLASGAIPSTASRWNICFDLPGILSSSRIARMAISRTDFCKSALRTCRLVTSDSIPYFPRH